jgi:glycosyltransferase involved in cell wall biosynthesis
MSLPKFTIVMATLNSMRTLERSLQGVRMQDYPADKIELLVVDGGSTDGTRELALKYGGRVIDNPYVEPIRAKIIGLHQATGDYLMWLDSDEVLLSPQALRKRAHAFTLDPQVKMVFAYGYHSPKGFPFASVYINEFGDPFSQFFYRLSRDERFFLKDMRGTCTVVHEDQDCAVVELGDGPQPILENACCGNVMDLQFFRSQFPELLETYAGPVHFFYYMQKFTKRFAITKDDSLLHFSADHISNFLPKIRWRVRNNVFYPKSLGASGFMGREGFDSPWRRLKKYLYLPYAFLFLPVALDALWLCATRRDLRWLYHIPLTLYTAVLISGMMILKFFGYKAPLKSYGDQKPISESFKGAS